MEKDRTIKVFKDGNEVEVYIKDLSLEEREKAEGIRIKKWNAAIQNGAIFAEKLGKVLKDQGIWDDEKENKINELRLEITDCLNTLDKGGIKLSDAKNIALKIRDLREEINILSVNRIRYINETIEGQAQNAEFDYLVSQCAVYSNNRDTKYFANYEDYLNRKNNLDSYMISSKVAEIMYGGGEENWPENQFLKTYKFIDDKLRLVNKEGHLIDSKEKLIDEFGNYVSYDKNGKKVYVDEDGKTLEVNIERKPFLDDDGVPIVEASIEVLTEVSTEKKDEVDAQ